MEDYSSVKTPPLNHPPDKIAHGSSLSFFGLLFAMIKVFSVPIVACSSMIYFVLFSDVFIPVSNPVARQVNPVFFSSKRRPYRNKFGFKRNSSSWLPELRIASFFLYCLKSYRNLYRYLCEHQTAWPEFVDSSITDLELYPVQSVRDKLSLPHDMFFTIVESAAYAFGFIELTRAVPQPNCLIKISKIHTSEKIESESPTLHEEPSVLKTSFTRTEGGCITVNHSNENLKSLNGFPLLTRDAHLDYAIYGSKPVFGASKKHAQMVTNDKTYDLKFVAWNEDFLYYSVIEENIPFGSSGSPIFSDGKLISISSAISVSQGEYCPVTIIKCPNMAKFSYPLNPIPTISNVFCRFVPMIDDEPYSSSFRDVSNSKSYYYIVKESESTVTYSTRVLICCGGFIFDSSDRIINFTSDAVFTETRMQGMDQNAKTQERTPTINVFNWQIPEFLRTIFSSEFIKENEQSFFIISAIGLLTTVCWTTHQAKEACVARRKYHLVFFVLSSLASFSVLMTMMTTYLEAHASIFAIILIISIIIFVIEVDNRERDMDKFQANSFMGLEWSFIFTAIIFFLLLSLMYDIPILSDLMDTFMTDLGNKSVNVRKSLKGFMSKGTKYYSAESLINSEDWTHVSNMLSSLAARFGFDYQDINLTSFVSKVKGKNPYIRIPPSIYNHWTEVTAFFFVVSYLKCTAVCASGHITRPKESTVYGTMRYITTGPTMAALDKVKFFCLAGMSGYCIPPTFILIVWLSTNLITVPCYWLSCDMADGHQATSASTLNPAKVIAMEINIPRPADITTSAFTSTGAFSIILCIITTNYLSAMIILCITLATVSRHRYIENCVGFLFIVANPGLCFGYIITSALLIKILLKVDTHMELTSANATRSATGYRVERQAE